MARPTIFAGNWKMFKTGTEAASFIQQLNEGLNGVTGEVMLAVPFTAISRAATAAEGSPIKVGAQNMHDATDGAFTGEIASGMLQEAGASFVILGHSERRHVFNEDDAFINRKVHRALEAGLQPIVCVGETLEQRDAGETEAVLEEQLSKSLEGVTAEQMAKIVVAYEPVWAIGTGKTATPDVAQKAHAFVREQVGKLWTKTVAKDLPLLYGGSVKPDNAATLIDQTDIDGVLVGGASLDPKVFGDIIHCKQQKVV